MMARVWSPRATAQPLHVSRANLSSYLCKAGWQLLFLLVLLLCPLLPAGGESDAVRRGRSIQQVGPDGEGGRGGGGVRGARDGDKRRRRMQCARFSSRGKVLQADVNLALKKRCLMTIIFNGTEGSLATPIG